MLIDKLIDLICQDKDYVKKLIKSIFSEYYAKNIDRIITYKKEGKIIAFAHYLMISDGQLQLLNKYGKEALRVIKDTNGPNIFIPAVVVDKENRNRNIPLKMARFLIKQQSEAKTFSWFEDSNKIKSFKLNGGGNA